MPPRNGGPDDQDPPLPAARHHRGAGRRADAVQLHCDRDDGATLKGGPRRLDRGPTKSEAPATMGSSLNTFPQEAIPRFVVRAMLPFRYFWLTTWNSVAAASAGSGR